MVGMNENGQIAKDAIAYVKRIYPNAKDAKVGSGYDLEIDNRIIEVKGTRSENWRQNIFLSRQPERDAIDRYRERYWLFRVFNVGKSDICLKEIQAKDLDPEPDPRWRVKIKGAKA